MTDRKIETISQTTGRTLKDTVVGQRENAYDRYAKEKGPVELEIDSYLELKLSTGCALCGEQRSLKFHHKNPLLRKFRISTAPHGMTLGRLKAEVSKCVVLCARCHKLIHNETPPPSYIIDRMLFVQLQKAVAEAVAAKTALRK